MNKGRKTKKPLDVKDEENSSPKNEATSSKYKLTPCRRVGLNRKRKSLILSGSSSEININSPNNSLTEIEISVKEHNILDSQNSTSSFIKSNLESSPRIKESMKSKKNSTSARKRIHKNMTNNSSDNIIVSPNRKIKNSKHELNSDVHNKHFCEVRVVLTRCDFVEPMLKLNTIHEPSVEKDILMDLENEAVSNTTESLTEENNSEIQTNQISTTIEDAIPEPPLEDTVTNLTNGKVEEEILKKNVDREELNNENTHPKILDVPLTKDDEISDFKIKKKRKSRSFNKKSLITSTPNEISLNIEDLKVNTENNENSFNNTTPNFWEETKAEPSINKTNSIKNGKMEVTDKKKVKRVAKKRFDHNSYVDSDEVSDFNVKDTRRRKKSAVKKSPKRSSSSKKEIVTKFENITSKSYNTDSDDDFMEKPRRKKKLKDIKKKILLPVYDPLNKIEHIRIGENKSYTIMHKGNISSYVKYYDNDTIKITESDDNQQTSSQPPVSNVKVSMIIERKNYLPKGSDERPMDTNEISNVNNSVMETASVDNSVMEIASVDKTATKMIEKDNGNKSIVETPIINNSAIDYVETSNVNNLIDIEASNNLNDSIRDTMETSNNSVGDIIDATNSNNNSVVDFIEKPFANTMDDIDIIVVPNVNDSVIDNVEETDPIDSDDTQEQINKIIEFKNNLMNLIKTKRDKLDSLKRIMAYKEEHNLEELKNTTMQFKYTLQQALIDLLSHLKTHTERNFNMLLLLGFLKIPNEMVAYNEETESFE